VVTIVAKETKLRMKIFAMRGITASKGLGGQSQPTMSLEQSALLEATAKKGRLSPPSALLANSTCSKEVKVRRTAPFVGQATIVKDLISLNPLGCVGKVIIAKKELRLQISKLKKDIMHLKAHPRSTNAPEGLTVIRRDWQVANPVKLGIIALTLEWITKELVLRDSTVLHIPTLRKSGRTTKKSHVQRGPTKARPLNTRLRPARHALQATTV